MKIRDVLKFSAAHNGGVLFGEAARIAAKASNFSGSTPVSASSAVLNDLAEKIQRERGCNFGLALQLARRELEFDI
jgi:hypothetical protein